MQSKVLAKTVIAALVISLFMSDMPAASLANGQEGSVNPASGTRRLLADLSDDTSMTVSKIPQGNAYIPADTLLQVELIEELSSKKNHVGDNVRLRTVENLIVNDVIVVPAGSVVSGQVTKATGSGLFGRAGKLEFTIDSVKALNGVELPLEYATLREAGSDDGAVAVVAAVSVIGGLFMKGKNVTFPAGTKMDVRVTTDTDLQVKLEDLAEEMDPGKPHGQKIVIQ